MVDPAADGDTANLQKCAGLLHGEGPISRQPLLRCHALPPQLLVYHGSIVSARLHLNTSIWAFPSTDIGKKWRTRHRDGSGLRTCKRMFEERRTSSVTGVGRMGRSNCEGVRGSRPTRLQASGPNGDRWGGAAASFWSASGVRGQLNVREEGGVLAELGVMQLQLLRNLLQEALGLVNGLRRPAALLELRQRAP